MVNWHTVAEPFGTLVKVSVGGGGCVGGWTFFLNVHPETFVADDPILTTWLDLFFLQHICSGSTTNALSFYLHLWPHWTNKKKHEKNKAAFFWKEKSKPTGI